MVKKQQLVRLCNAPYRDQFKYGTLQYFKALTINKRQDCSLVKGHVGPHHWLKAETTFTPEIED